MGLLNHTHREALAHIWIVIYTTVSAEPLSRPAASRPEGLALTTAVPGLPRLIQARSLWSQSPGKLTTLQASLYAADRALAPPRFGCGLSTSPGGFATEDLGVSPDRTLTGWPP